MGLTAVCRTRRYRRWRKGPREASARPCATISGVVAEAITPNSGAYILLTVFEAQQGKVAEIRLRGARARPPHPPSRAQRPRTHAGPVPPPSARPTPSPRPRRPSLAHTARPRSHPPHAIHAARAPLGPARPLAVPSGATSNVVSDRAANGLVAPRGRGAPLLTVFPPVRPGARCPWSRLRPRAAYARVPRHSLYGYALLGHLATLLCVCFLPGSSW